MILFSCFLETIFIPHDHAGDVIDHFALLRWADIGNIIATKPLIIELEMYALAMHDLIKAGPGQGENITRAKKLSKQKLDIPG